MNFTRGLLRRRPALDRPGAAFVFADGEERHVTEQIVTGSDHAIEARLDEAEIGEERLGIVAFEPRDLELDLRAQRDGPGRAVAGQKRRQPGFLCGSVDARADRSEIGLVEIDHEEQRLGGEELKPAQQLQVGTGQSQRPQRLALFKRRATALDEVALLFELGRLPLLQILFDPLEPPLGHAEVCEDEFVFHRLRVARRIDRAGGGRNRFVAKGADHVYERVGVLVAGDVDEPLGAAACWPDHVGELHRRRNPLSRVVHAGEDVEAVVRDFGDPDVDVALAPRRLLGARHELEQRRLATGGKADERRAEHKRPSLSPTSSRPVQGSDPDGRHRG